MARRHELGVGCLMLAALVLTAGMALQIGAIGRLGPTVDVTVPFADAAGLTSGAEVGVAGVKVGHVTDLVLDGDRAIVHLSLDAEAGVRRDARARIRMRSLLGEKYVELDPGSPEAPLLADGDELPPAGVQVEIDELVQALGPLLGALDPELVAEVTAAVADALRDDPERVARVLGDLETLVANAAEASEDLPELASEARATLRHVDSRAQQAAGVLERADRALSKLEEAAEPLPETVDEARAAIAEVRQVVGQLDGSTEELEAALGALSSFDRAAIEGMLRDEGIRVRFTKRKERDR